MGAERGGKEGQGEVAGQSHKVKGVASLPLGRKKGEEEKAQIVICKHKAQSRCIHRTAVYEEETG